MTRGLALFCVVTLILGFQNCSPQGQLLGEEVLSSNIPPEGISPNQITFIEVPDVSSTTAGGITKLSPSGPAGRLVISMNSGAISLLDSGDEVVAKRCLSPVALEELQNILEGSSICSTQVSTDEDLACAMVYTAGYASLRANDQSITLGEEVDSCGRGRKDLCGDVAGVFKNYISFVRQQWEEMACQN